MHLAQLQPERAEVTCNEHIELFKGSIASILALTGSALRSSHCQLSDLLSLVASELHYPDHAALCCPVQGGRDDQFLSCWVHCELRLPSWL